MTLAAHAVSVRVGSTTLLDRVSLTLAPGELVAVVGTNGAGKSTLLRVLIGDLRPWTGEVRLAGRPLTAWKGREVARMRAVLPQDSALTFPFTALEVVLMGRAPHCGTQERPVDYAIANAALAATDALPLAERLYPTLSGGERQRVQLARVLAQIWEAPPDAPLVSPHRQTGQERYLLLDEPTSNLDLAHQHATLRVTRTLAQTGVGVLAIVHDLNLAAQYADRVVVLKGGTLMAAGPTPEILTPTILSKAFAIPVSVIPHPTLPCPLVITGTPVAA
ncbi:MAG: heme ABC transporter ATP-binding protein [Caldilineaceae bacterium]|nr:heme ABC transporter ATP-binding protein [Caldilineaceae bacterium]